MNGGGPIPLTGLTTEGKKEKEGPRATPSTFPSAPTERATSEKTDELLVVALGKTAGKDMYFN